EDEPVEREEVDQRGEQRQRDLEQDEVRQRAPADPLLPLAPESGSMLPDRLEGPVAPAVALAPERDERRRRLGPGPRLLDVDDLPAGPAEGDRRVGVLGERRPRDPADLRERLPPKRTDRPRDRGHALEDV